MDVKLLEIRDRATFIPVMAVRLTSRNAHEFYLLQCAGYSAVQITTPELPDSRDPNAGPEPYVILCKLDGVEAHYDSYDWPNQRTMGNAHRHIIECWNDLVSGSVVDVEYILGEVIVPKKSEKYA